jgi:hypothetical protein
MFGRADLVIWLDGRPHPSAYAEHAFAASRPASGTGARRGVVEDRDMMTIVYGGVRDAADQGTSRRTLRGV